MITVVSGTNRPGSNTLKVAKLVTAEFSTLGRESTLLDLGTLPAQIFDPSSYSKKPDDLDSFQQALLNSWSG